MKTVVVAAFLLLSVVSIVAVLFDRRFVAVRWPLLAFLGAWTATTGLAAAYTLLPGGTAALRTFLGWLSPEIEPVIGSFDYAVLLLLPYVIVPLSALAGARGVETIIAPATPAIQRVHVPSEILWMMLAVAVGYCLLNLYQTGHMLPQTLISSDNYEDKIRARVQMMGELPFVFYAVFYAVLPTITVLLLARFLEERRPLDLAGVALTYLFFVYLTAATYLKAPTLYVIIMLAAAVVVARIGWRTRLACLAGLAGLAAVTFVSLQVLMGGTGSVVVATKPAPVKPAVVQKAAPKPVAAVKVVRSEDAPILAQYRLAVMRTAESLIFRMGSSFPYYVAVFDDPAERCGLELPPLSTSSCVIPVKIHAAIYPHVTFVTGFSPAAAHVSAFGEAGMAYTILVMVLAGLSLGVIGSIALHASGAMQVAMQAIGVIYGYFLTQVPLIGALTYGHGLAFYLAPIAVLAAYSLLRKKEIIHAT